MFTFIDGHLILAAFLSPVVALLLVGSFNVRQRTKVARRQKLHRQVVARRTIFAARGGAR